MEDREKTATGDTSKDSLPQPAMEALPMPATRRDSAGEEVVLPGADSAPPVIAGTGESSTVEGPLETSNNPAVIALLDETDFNTEQGNAAGAASSLERALRLEPKNPWLWHRLAVLRFQQRRWRQAITLAEKSNSLSARRPELRNANSELIKQARQH